MIKDSKFTVSKAGRTVRASSPRIRKADFGNASVRSPTGGAAAKKAGNTTRVTPAAGAAAGAWHTGSQKSRTAPADRLRIRRARTGHAGIRKAPQARVRYGKERYAAGRWNAARPAGKAQAIRHYRYRLRKTRDGVFQDVGGIDPSKLPEDTRRKFESLPPAQREAVIRHWQEKGYGGSSVRIAGTTINGAGTAQQGQQARLAGPTANVAGGPGQATDNNDWEAFAASGRYRGRKEAAGQQKPHRLGTAVRRTRDFVRFVDEEDKVEQVKEHAVNEAKRKTYETAAKPAKYLGRKAGELLKRLGSAAMHGIGSVAAAMGLPLFVCMLLMVVAVMAVTAFTSADSRTTADGMPLYYQYDPQWGSVPYGGGTIASSGCGITSMAMVVSYWTGDAITPDILTAQWGDKYYMEDVGSKMYDMAGGAAEKYGLAYKDLGNDIGQVVKELRQGHSVIASCHAGIFTDGGHIIVLRGLDENGKVLVNDPNDNDSKDFYNTPFDKETIAENCKYYISMWGEVSLEGGDAELLARLVQCEAGSSWNSDKQQRLVASVVINRVRSSSWPDSINGVIYQSGQFAPAMNGTLEKAKPSSRVIQNVNYVLKNGPIDTQVVFLANFKQGTTKYTFSNPYLSEDNKYKYQYFGY